jgi:hypothetical protein
MSNPYRQEIIDIVTDNPNQYTYRDVGQMFNIDSETVRGVARQNNLTGFFRKKKGGGIIGTDSTSQRNTSMEPNHDQIASFEKHCKDNGLPFVFWRGFWHKTPQYSSFFVNKEAMQQDEQRFAQLIADIKRHAPKYKKRKVDPTGDHMLVLPQADIHVGKWSSIAETGSTYNMHVAVERAKAGTDALVAKSRLFGTKSFVICIGNDILHTDNGKTTTSGTPQDNDGSWFENFRLARALYVSIIEQLALYGDVYLVYVPSNHDWRSGFALSETVAAHFHKHPNVSSLITERHRKYIVYGTNLIMFSHGDGAKEKDLHWHMATEAHEAWGKTTHRYIYLGHLHHKIRKVQGHQNAQQEKDKIGFTEIDVTVQQQTGKDVAIEYVRSPSSSDGWHDRNGYTSKPAMEAFLHHHSAGQVARFSHWF